jgi:hypothetical protein
VHEVVDAGGQRLVPYSRDNSLIRNRVVLFPDVPQEYGTKADLLASIALYIDRYVDLTPAFLRLAAHYVLLSWVHDNFNELPYLRLRGDFGTGKTRFLLAVGSICYKPIFASGASTVSPIFHMLDAFRGTLLIDEADFRFSDEKAQIVKILNNGNARGFPVLRTESQNGREFSPRAFHVFGPKVIAMRGQFEDPALESRFLSERSGGRPLRDDIPISLPPAQAQEAQQLRNQLLLFRFRNATKFGPTRITNLELPAVEPRLLQILAPLAAMVDDRETLQSLQEIAGISHAALLDERGATVEADILLVLRNLCDRQPERSIALRDIARLFAAAFAKEYGHVISARWIGNVIRRRLAIVTNKSHGVYVIALSERRKLRHLWERYGITAEDAARLPVGQG